MRRFAPLLLLLILFAAFRLGSASWDGFPVNAQPVAALLFCAYGAFQMKGAGLALLSWLACYPLLNTLLGYPPGAGFVTSVLGLAVVLAFAVLFPFKKRSAFSLVGGSLFSAFLFYVVTNTTVWMGMGLYAKNWEGFYQAQWAGHPSHVLPTWVFLKNSLLGNGLFALLYTLAQVRVGDQRSTCLVGREEMH